MKEAAEKAVTDKKEALKLLREKMGCVVENCQICHHSVKKIKERV